MDFLTFLDKYENENVSDVKDLIETKKQIEDKIIAEAFNRSEYPSKKEALLNLERVFVSEQTAPKSIDVGYIKEHMDELRDSINNLSEGDIRIIIHNHEGPGKSKGPGPANVEMADEGATPKKKRGRPRKEDFTKAPKNTGVIYDENDPVEGEEIDVDVEEVEEDTLIDKDSLKDGEPKKVDDIELKPVAKKEGIGISFDDANDKLEKSEKKDRLVDELEELDLSEEELQQATAAASGTLDEEEELTEKVAKASNIIKQISEITQ